MTGLATPPNDDTKMLFKLLSDREWHSYTEIKKALARTVPPGRALRKYAERVEYNRRSQHASYEVMPSEDAQIELGQLGIAQACLSSWRGRGIMFRGKGSGKEIKVKPGFTSYGIPGFEPGNTGTGEQDPDFQGAGVPEVSPDDFEPPAEDGRAGNEDHPVVHAHGQHTFHEHSAADYADHQQPIEGERLPTDPLTVVDDPIERPPADAEPVDEVPKWVPLQGENDEQPLSDPHSDEAYRWPTNTVMVPVTATACIGCGMLVLDVELHQKWHLELTEERSGPDFTLEELMQRFDNAISGKLDSFQAGMELWLTDQFTALEQAIALSRTPVRWRDMQSHNRPADPAPRKSE